MFLLHGAWLSLTVPLFSAALNCFCPGGPVSSAVNRRDKRCISEWHTAALQPLARRRLQRHSCYLQGFAVLIGKEHVTGDTLKLPALDSFLSACVLLTDIVVCIYHMVIMRTAAVIIDMVYILRNIIDWLIDQLSIVLSTLKK